MPHLITDWSTDDPRLAETLKLVASFPEHSVERLELEAALHRFQADWCLREAGEIRGWKRAGAVQSRRGRKAAGARSDHLASGDTV